MSMFEINVLHDFNVSVLKCDTYSIGSFLTFLEVIRQF